MKHGIDKLIEILNGYTDTTAYMTKWRADIHKEMNPDAALNAYAAEEPKVKAKIEAYHEQFTEQITKTRAGIIGERQTSKYLSDGGFSTAVQAIAAGGARMPQDVVKALVRPFLDDYVARWSLSTILAEQGRDPKFMGIEEPEDPVAILDEIARNAHFTFNAHFVSDTPMTSAPQMVIRRLERAAAILDGSYFFNAPTDPPRGYYHGDAPENVERGDSTFF